jgi:translation initiation factor IF-1
MNLQPLLFIIFVSSLTLKFPLLATEISSCQHTALVTSIDTTHTKVALEKEFSITTSKQLSVFLSSNAQITITQWNQPKVWVKLELEGNSLQAACEQLPEGVLISSQFSTVTSLGTSSGTIQLKIPADMQITVQLLQGSLTLSQIQGTIRGNIQEGDISLSDVEGGVELSTQKGNVTCRGGQLEGSITTNAGNVLVNQVKGTFTGAAPNATFSVASPSQVVEASLLPGNVRLKVAEGDVQATTFDANLEVTVGKGAVGSGPQDITLTATHGELTLRVPPQFPMEASLEHVRTTPTGAVCQTSSDFDLGPTPSETSFQHQGKTIRVAQVKKNLGGGNQVTIRVVDGKVNLKKIL